MTLADWLQLIGTFGGFAGVMIYIGRLLQRLETQEKRGDAQEVEMRTLTDASSDNQNALGEVRGDVVELRGSLKELDSLKTLPGQIMHMSSQVDKIAGTMEKMSSEVQGLQTLSQLKNQMLELLKDASKDHEERLRHAEAQIRDQR